jgi:hypothetical protein
MAKEEPITVEAIVTESLPNARFRAKLESGHEILAHVRHPQPQPGLELTEVHREVGNFPPSGTVGISAASDT